MERITYDSTNPEDLKAGNPMQELALRLGWSASAIAGWRKTGVPENVNNALRHILYLEAECAHARWIGGDRD